jgi:hypothetical protein
MKIDQLKLIYGFSLLAALVALSLVLAIGHVQKETSYGLEIILDGITGLSIAYSAWIFSDRAPELYQWKMIYGFSLLVSMLGLGMVIAIGHIQKETSYGLEVVLPSIGGQSIAFAAWAFSDRAGKVGAAAE